MAKLLPFAAPAALHDSLRRVNPALGCASGREFCGCWEFHSREVMRCKSEGKRRLLVSVVCGRAGGSKGKGGKQAVLEQQGKKGGNASVSKKRLGKESEEVDLWVLGARITALEPREEEEYLPLAGKWRSARSSGRLQASQCEGSKDDEVTGEEVLKGSEEEKWVEVDDVEWDRNLNEGEEDVELVEVWEGDLGPMTAEEEAALLLEAEQEIAELEREWLEKEASATGGVAAPSSNQAEESIHKGHVTEMEKELARLKDLVSKMEEQIAGGDCTSASNVKPKQDDVVCREGNGGGIAEPSKSRFLEMYAVDEEEGIVRRSDKGRSQDEARDDSVLTGVSGSGNDSDEESWEDVVEEAHGELRKMVGGRQGDDRGIPAVMRCFDRAKVYVKAGDGGDGVVAFRREKFVPFGGPSGGNGGDGGNVYIEADASLNSLLCFRRCVHFRAGRGSHGQGKAKSGATGEHCVVSVPLGTVVRESGGDGDVLLELTKVGQRELLLPGGRGGRGNGAFKTGKNKTPQMAENGEEGAEMWLDLELKLVADVGIIGVPNAGKSTLLSAVCAARPEIANYPFTTLLPNLGVVALGLDASMVVADLPGLLEGAHSGYGLGHEFLRHTERCKVLIHVVDGMSQQAEYEYEAVRLELQLFNPELEHKPFLVAYNKMDIPAAADRWDSFQKFLRSKGVEPFSMSAATQQGTKQVITAAYELLKQIPEPEEEEEENAEELKSPAVGDIVKRLRSAPIEDFAISCDKHTRTWQVEGAGLNRFTQMTNWEYFEAVRRFQRVLDASGVNKALREQGVQEGDTVIVGQMELNWRDTDDKREMGDWKRGIRGSKVWPH